MAIFKKLVRSAEGAHVPHHKNTDDFMTVACPVPAKAIYPMSQHIGAPCTPAVQKGDEVFVGSVLGTAGGFVSADIHSGVSGTVAGIEEVMLPSGARVPAVVVDSNGEQTPHPDIKPPVVTDHESFVAAVRASGLVGLGGAGFPTAVKLAPKDLDAVTTLVINGAECEPYITVDNREFLEHPDHVINGIKLVMQYLNLEKTIIGIEDNKQAAIALMREKAAGTAIEVAALPAQYPQGAEKVLVEQTTGLEVPRGGLPADVGVVVMNVASVAFISKYMETGMPLVSKRLTIDGDAIAQAKNVQAVIGTPLKDIVDFCGGYKGEVAKIISGGPMMGAALVNDEIPLMKQNNAFLFFGPELAAATKESPCIRCGRCISACPMGLSPVEIATAHDRRDADSINALQTDLCMECGCCSFVCPAKRPVTQTMRMAKAFQRAQGGK